MIESIFKNSCRKSKSFSSHSPVFEEIVVIDNLLSDDGKVISKLATSKLVPFDELDVLPDSHDYTLEDLLKAGVTPKEVPTHGLLDDSNFDINSAFDNFVSIINSSSSSNVDKEPVIEDNVVTEYSDVKS